MGDRAPSAPGQAPATGRQASVFYGRAPEYGRAQKPNQCTETRIILIDAEKFTDLLGDATRREVLTKLRLSTHEVIAKLESNKRVLGCKRAELDAELDRVRQMGIAQLEKEEIEYQASAVKSLEKTLEEAIAPSLAITPAVPVNEDDTSLKMDDIDVIGDDRPIEPTIVSEHAIEMWRVGSLEAE